MRQRPKTTLQDLDRIVKSRFKIWFKQKVDKDEVERSRFKDLFQGQVLKVMNFGTCQVNGYKFSTKSASGSAAVIDAALDPEPVQLQKLLPKLLKWNKSDGFRAKSAILSLIGSVVSAGGAKSSNVLKFLIECLVEFLSNEDWTVRKAAAEALLKLDVTEKCSLFEYKSSCLVCLESRRFDKGKVVRDTMNQALEMWKTIIDEEDLWSPQLSIACLNLMTGSYKFSTYLCRLYTHMEANMEASHAEVNGANGVNGTNGVNGAHGAADEALPKYRNLSVHNCKEVPAGSMPEGNDTCSEIIGSEELNSAMKDMDDVDHAGNQDDEDEHEGEEEVNRGDNENDGENEDDDGFDNIE
ncbi:hypothetical protein AgCh_004322 [Apium graveolens]